MTKNKKSNQPSILRVSPDTISITIRGIQKPVIFAGEVEQLLESKILKCLGLKPDHLIYRKKNSAVYNNKRRGIHFDFKNTSTITFHGKFWTNATAWTAFKNIVRRLTKSGFPITLSRIDVCADLACPVERLYNYRQNQSNPFEQITKDTVFKPIYKNGDENFNRRVFVGNKAFEFRIYRKDIEVIERYRTRNKKKGNRHDAKNKFYFKNYEPFFDTGVSRIEVKYCYSRASRMFSIDDIFNSNREEFCQMIFEDFHSRHLRRTRKLRTAISRIFNGLY